MCARRKTGDQFNGADAGKPATFAEQPVVGGAFQFDEIVEKIVIALGEKIEDGGDRGRCSGKVIRRWVFS